ncbi:MAG TPA: hypothetical protein VIK91_27205, partial [Nannocystis sp.]
MVESPVLPEVPSVVGSPVEDEPPVDEPPVVGAPVVGAAVVEVPGAVEPDVVVVAPSVAFALAVPSSLQAK